MKTDDAIISDLWHPLAKAKSYGAHAHWRAGELLLSHLSPEQQTQLAEREWFDVVGGRTGRRYRIFTARAYAGESGHYGYSHNVALMDGKKVVESYCAYPTNGRYFELPAGDILLAQKLALETDDRHFTNIACYVQHRRRPGARGTVRLPRRTTRWIYWPLMFVLYLNLFVNGVALIIKAFTR